MIQGRGRIPSMSRRQVTAPLSLQALDPISEGDIMSRNASASESGPAKLSKARTGIAGFDEITYGGLPRGRPTLVCGAAGSGKTLFGMEFLIRGAVESGE